jgi:uncharacterized membrane protein HdeD (DUF308 family)
MALGDRLRRLDDNAPSRGVLWISDHFGWWWNACTGVVLLAVGLLCAATGQDTDVTIACFAFGTAALAVGGVMAVGRRRRARRTS